MNTGSGMYAVAIGMLIILALPIQAGAQESGGLPSTSPLDELAWMAGCWARETPSSRVEELWTRPAGGIMLGVSRTVREGAPTSFEHLLLHVPGEAVVYRASPSGQATTDFTATLLSDTLAVFENPRHDFPRRIAYRPAAGDSLHARVEGPGRDGGTSGFTVRYGRTMCPGLAAHR